MLDEKLLKVLVCPVTGGELVYDAESCELISRKAGLAFPVLDGIPVMLVSEARKLDQKEDLTDEKGEEKR